MKTEALWQALDRPRHSVRVVHHLVATVRLLATEQDAQRTQVGVQTGILNRQNVRWLPRLVVVRVPKAGWCDKHRVRLPVNPLTISD